MKKALLLFCLVIISGLVEAQVELSAIFTDNMVLQRDQPIRIWGTAKKGESVTVSINRHNSRVKADKSGKWKAELPSMSAGGPYEVSISAKSGNKTLTNVLIGDIWLCSGQSNMEWTVAYSNNPEEEIANSDYPNIRHFKVPHGWNKDKQEDLEGGPWKVAGPETTGDFTAVGYYFARELQKEVDVPIGLLNSSWGGSRIEPWMRSEILGDYIDGDINTYLEKIEKERQEELAKIEARVYPLPDNQEFKNALVEGYDASSWDKMDLPVLWEQSGYGGMDGIAWLRKEIVLSKEEAEAGITLNLAMIDDSDWTYVNGTMVGSLEGQWNAHRKYDVKAANLHEGSNIILVRVEDTGGGGGLYGDAADLFYSSSTGKHDLSGEWRFKVEKIGSVSGSSFQPNQTPTVLYNKMIHPILDLPIKGVLWYQGESNAGPEDAYVYRDLFKNMITDWRNLWGQEDMPFLWVQLANYLQPDAQPAESTWAVLRESQSAALELPNTAEAVIIDIGEANDIHPRNKQDVGLRLSIAARKIAFDQDIEHSGPVFKSSTVKENTVVIDFHHKGKGLMTKDKYGYVKGLALAGKDKKFYWAKALIKDGMVHAWSDEVPEPEFIRYAWGDNPDDANLYNAEGLPARPFRTDK